MGRHNILIGLTAAISGLAAAVGMAFGQFGGAFPNPENRSYGTEAKVALILDPSAIITADLIDRIMFSDAVLEKAVRDLGGKRDGDRKWPVKVMIDGQEVEIGPFMGKSEFPARSMGGPAAVVLNYGMAIDPSEEDRKKLSEEALKKKYGPIAAKASEPLYKRLAEAMTVVTRKQFGKQLDRQAKLAAIENELARKAEADLEVARQNLRKQSTGIPEAVMLENVAHLQKQRQALELELAGLQGRAEAIQMQIGKVEALPRRNQQKADLVDNLNKVLKLRQMEFERNRTLHSQGIVSPTELRGSEEKVLLAEIDLAKAKSELNITSRDLTDKLVAELAQIAIATADNEAKLKYVREKLELDHLKLEQEMALQPQRERLAADSAAVQAQVLEARKKLSELRQADFSFRPATVESFGEMDLVEKYELWSDEKLEEQQKTFRKEVQEESRERKKIISGKDEAPDESKETKPKQAEPSKNGPPSEDSVKEASDK